MDVDDVWYPWYRRAHEICCDAGIVPRTETGEFITPRTWSAHEEYGVKKQDWVRVLEDAGKDLYDADPDPAFLPMMADFAMAGHEVWFITARGSFGPPGMQQNIRRWTREYFEQIGLGYNLRERLIFSKDKTILRVDAYVDDRLDHCEAVEDWGTPAFLMTQPWNIYQHLCTGVTRIRGLAEFKHQIRALETKSL